MNRRDFLKAIGSGAVAIAVPAVALGSSGLLKSPLPFIVGEVPGESLLPKAIGAIGQIAEMRVDFRNEMINLRGAYGEPVLRAVGRQWAEIRLTVEIDERAVQTDCPTPGSIVDAAWFRANGVDCLYEKGDCRIEFPEDWLFRIERITINGRPKMTAEFELVEFERGDPFRVEAIS